MIEYDSIQVYYCRSAVPENGLPLALRHAGASGSVHLETVPCSGRIDPRYILKAFEAGATAVCIVACPVNACKSMEGSARAGRRVELVRELMAEAGLDPNALVMFRPDSLDPGALETIADRVAAFVDGCLQPEQRVATL